MERPQASLNEPFDGALLRTTPSQGIRFLHVGNATLTCHFGGRDPDELVLACVRHGSVRIRHGRDRETLVDRASGLLVFDQDRPMVTAHQRIGWTCLKLSRALAVEAFGARPIARDEVIRPFRHPGRLLSGLLRHLDDMVEIGRHPDPVETASAVHTARSLVLTLFAKRNPRRRLLSCVYDDALLAAAQYQLRVHVGDPELNGARVAATLGCSRVHLYRQFARQGTSIREVLHAVRMERARELLLATRTPIGMIAWECGYTSPTAFDRAFRQRFGVVPIDLRQQHATTRR
ncbi:MAG TPA: helix-turn-helix transcriptional regulator [Rhodanobacteraceae bacterium]